MPARGVAALALVFSGATALVYQILWTRLLGLVFGTGTEAVGTVLAVFFGGMALGNAAGARGLGRLRRPYRVYALLELAVGAFALASLPLLREIGALYAWVGTDHGPAAMTALRLGAAVLVLLPPTAAMGATLPVMARGAVVEDATLGRWSALLYAANTLGAVAGAYLCGFWLLPGLGVTHTLLLAAGVNVAVGGGLLLLARGEPARLPLAEAPTASAEAGAEGPARTRIAFLAFFGVSGFVGIGYEVIWSKLFAIVMEGTVYGFATVLSAYLLGIALGSAAAARVVDRIVDLPRAFGLLHAAIAVAVAGGMALVPWLPFVHGRLAAWTGDADPLHLLFLLVLPVVLVPAALFGAAFPVLVRIYTRRAAAAGEGMGLALAVNTTGSIAASLLLGFWAHVALGMDASLYALLLLDLAVALIAILAWQRAEGLRRIPGFAAGAVAFFLVVLVFDGVHVERTIAGRNVQASTLEAYGRSVERAVDRQIFVAEGRNAVVSVTEDGSARGLQTNGLPEAGSFVAPPYRPLTTTLLGVVPYVAAEAPERALVVGLGAGNTVAALLETPLERIDVVELEPAVVDAVAVLHEGRESPLADPRVELRVNDGRNELLLARHRGERWDLIASQPSHPWRMGAANLFTEDFFRIARGALTEEGAFAVWLNGFRTDRASFLAVLKSFERVFPGAWLVDVSDRRDRSALLLVGTRDPFRLPAERARRRLGRGGLAELLALHELEGLEALLGRFEGPLRAFPLEAARANTDDNAFVETRIPRLGRERHLDFAALEEALPAAAPVLPPGSEAADAAAVARSILEEAGGGPRAPVAKVQRLLEAHGGSVDPVRRATLRADARTRREASAEAGVKALRRLAAAHPDRPEPLRALGRHLAARERRFEPAVAAFAEAHRRSGAPRDAFDAARAAGHLDPRRAWRLAQRIPEAERERFPRLGLLEAKVRLARGERGASLRSLYRRLLDYRDTAKGRSRPGVSGVAARVAAALGEERAARAFRDADLRERRHRARSLWPRLQRALAEGRIEAARATHRELASLLPASPRVAKLGVRLAAARQDAEALEAALQSLHTWAPSPRAAVATENVLRRRLGLPLLAPRPAQSLLRRAAREEELTAPADAAAASAALANAPGGDLPRP